jgi:hypothetical protein
MAEVCLQVIRIQCQSAVEIRKRIRNPPHFAQCDAPVDQGIDECRVEPKGLVIAIQRLRHAAKRLERKAEIRVCGRLGCVQCNGTLDEFDRLLATARLIAHQAEQVDRIEVQGLAHENPAIAGLRLLKPAANMVAYGFLERSGSAIPKVVGLDH